jgi:hypothetical protein
MPILLRIFDLLVVLAVVITAMRVLWQQSSSNLGMLLLAICLTVALAIFGVVSLVAASGLAAGAGFDQGALFIFLVAIAIASGVAWVSKPA